MARTLAIESNAPAVNIAQQCYKVKFAATSPGLGWGQTRLPVQPVVGGSCHNGVVMRISPAMSARRAAVATRFGGQIWKGALIDEGENKLL